MIIINAVLIMAICVLANHLGLIEAIEAVIHKKLPIINCCKCSTFWFASAYLIISSRSFFFPLAGALLLSYVAIWIELLLGIVDKYYDKIYETIYGHRGEDSPTSSNEDDTDGQVSEMSKQ